MGNSGDAKGRRPEGRGERGKLHHGPAVPPPVGAGRQQAPLPRLCLADADRLVGLDRQPPLGVGQAIGHGRRRVGDAFRAVHGLKKKVTE